MPERNKIIMLAFQHSAKDDRIFYKEGLSLLHNGYSVSYIVLTDSEGHIKDMQGNVLNKKKELIFDLQGIRIIGIKPPVGFFNSILKKIFLGKFQDRVLKTILRENASVYHAHEPISLRFALKASERSNAKVIFDSHESWVGGTFKDLWIKKLYLNKVRYLITVNEGILKHLSMRTKLTISEVIYNCSLPNLFPVNKEPLKINNPIQLVHEGSLSFDRGLKNMLDSILILKQKNPNIKLNLVGGSPKKELAYITEFIQENKLQNNIRLTGWLAYENVSSHLKYCDIGLILFSSTKNNSYSTSNKLFNYIASGLAIISVNLSQSTKLLTPLKNTVFIENNSIEKIVQAIQFLIDDPHLLLQKKIASQKAYQKYNWLKEEKKLLIFYKKVLA